MRFRLSDRHATSARFCLAGMARFALRFRQRSSNAPLNAWGKTIQSNLMFYPAQSETAELIVHIFCRCRVEYEKTRGGLNFGLNWCYDGKWPSTKASRGK